MKLAILGATGRIGRTLVMQALDADHEVTALVCGRPEPGEIDDRVALVVGDVTSADSVNHVVDRNHAVLSTLGHAKGSSDNVLARAISNVITAMDADGVDRLVVLSSPRGRRSTGAARSLLPRRPRRPSRRDATRRPGS
jgi:putative NADH-flavin reductase